MVINKKLSFKFGFQILRNSINVKINFYLKKMKEKNYPLN